MEIGDQGIDSAKIVRRVNKESRFADEGLGAAGFLRIFAEEIFDGAGHCRSYSDSRGGIFCSKTLLESRRYFVNFAVDRMVFDSFRLDRLKSAETDVKGQVGEGKVFCKELILKSLGEMQTGCRGSSCDLLISFCINGLIAVAVGFASSVIFFAVNVRWQRYFAEPVYQIEKCFVFFRNKTDQSLPVLLDGEDLGSPFAG